MAKLLFQDDTTAEIVYPVRLDFPPYNGDVEFGIVAKTQTLLDEARKMAKKDQSYRERTRVGADGKRYKVDADPDGAFGRALLRLLIRSWKGVTDAEGNEIECTDETKSGIYNLVDVRNWIVIQAGQVAVVEGEAEEANFGS